MAAGRAGLRRAVAHASGRATRVTRSERDLVTALRDELAAIDPSRACDRMAEIDGLGPAPTGREASVGRLAHRLARSGKGSTAAPFAWDIGGGALPCRVAARPVPRPWLAQPGRRPDAPGVRGRAVRGGDPGRPSHGLRPAGVVAASAWSGCRDVQERRGGRDVPAPDRGIRGPPRGRGAAGLAGVARRAQPRPERGIGQPPARGECRRASARCDRDARRGRAPPGAAVRRPARRRRAARDPRGQPGRAGRAPRDPSLRRPARPRTPGAARDPRRRPRARRSGRPSPLWR